MFDLELTIPIITGLAAADAVNPCVLAILMIILSSIFVKYPKEKKKVLLAGFAFVLAVFLMFVPAIALYLVIPIANNWVIANLEYGLIYMFAISSLLPLGIIIAGFSSHNKYSMLGGIRSAYPLFQKLYLCHILCLIC